MTRVNSAMLSQNVNKSVTLVGRVVSFAGSYCVVEACDGGQVQVLLVPGSHIDGDNCVVEVMGVVNQDMSVQEQASTKFDHDYGTL
ncbi:hypothetical protein BCR33DRAFT_657973 [Rhizoclosmatium globosum]|uniref:Replication factor A protein 3 n=1 Tax=Rhizoclosmatium globosum TaxID=329046 RepID=A0A1Y2CLA9_9FUNG|nr:hypothetical protein BCR33DRAFT_657973 [Rhizoclosmatium globosum]|eukprot:ORY47783.1 hypothetical protein BCR33DRAFT_657973 [Rhizoclosmatium globosum]